jgi:hypothetical protein
MATLMQAFGGHAVYAATAIQGCIGDNAHQSLCRSAIDEDDPGGSQCAAERSRAVSELVRRSAVRSAKNGNCLDRSDRHWFDHRFVERARFSRYR